MDRRENADPRAPKRVKRDHIAIDMGGAKSHFAPGLFEEPNVNRLHQEYTKSAPFKHVVVEKLFNDGLVTRVKDECIRELGFTEKETDIYRVRASILWLIAYRLFYQH